MKEGEWEEVQERVKMMSQAKTEAKATKKQDEPIIVNFDTLSGHSGKGTLQLAGETRDSVTAYCRLCSWLRVCDAQAQAEAELGGHIREVHNLMSAWTEQVSKRRTYWVKPKEE